MSHWELLFCETFLNFVTLNGQNRLDGRHIESVFARLLRECGSFQNERTTNNTHFLYMCNWCSHTNMLLYTGVGHCCVYLHSGHSTTFLETNEIISTLSFCISQPHRRCYGSQKLESMKKTVLLLVLFLVLLPMVVLAQSLQSNVELKFNYKKGLYGYWGTKKNGKIGFVIKPKFEKASEFYGTHAFVMQNGLWGVIGVDGTFVKEPQYSNVLFKNREMAKLNRFIVEIGGLYGVMDISTCRIVVPFMYNDIKVTKGNNIFARKNGKWHLINIMTGKVVSYSPYDIVRLWSAYYMVFRGGKCGIITNDGKIVAEPIYDAIKPYQSNEHIKIVEQDGKFGFVNIANQMSTPCKYDAVLLQDDNMSENICCVQNGDKRGVVELYSLTEILPCRCDEIKPIAKHSLLIYRQGENYGITHYRGTTVIPPTINKTYGEKLLLNINSGNAFTIPTTDGKCYVMQNGKLTTLSEYVKKTPCEKVDKTWYSLRNFKRFEEDRSRYQIGNEKYYEEKIDGQIYSHTFINKKLSIRDCDFSMVLHCIDKKHYLYVDKKENRAKEVYKFCFEDLFDIKDRFSLVNIGLLASGDYLIETSSVETLFLGNLFPGYEKYVKSFEEYVYFMERDFVFTDTRTTKYLVIVDGKTFLPKRVALHPGDGGTLFGISNDGGWYMIGGRNTVVYRYNNRGEVQWLYNAPEGEKVDHIFETQAYSLLSGTTKNKGYVGFDNPLLVYVDKQTGERECEQHITMKSEAVPIVEYSKYKPIICFKDNVIVKRKILDTYAYGLLGADGDYRIEPIVVAGGETLSYGDWTINPLQIDANGNISDDDTKCVVNRKGEKFTIKEECAIKVKEEIAIRDSYVVGEIVKMNGAYGVVFEIDETGQHGKMISAEEACLAWSTEYITTKARNVYDGMANMNTIKALNPDLSKYPAFKWCAEYGTNWYLPSSSELGLILRKKSTINSALSANGYKIIMGDYYWSSFEYNNDCSQIIVREDRGACYVGKNYYYNVRAVLAF